MKRALLEIIASGVASIKKDLEEFVNLTLFYKQSNEKFSYFIENDDAIKMLLKSKKNWRRKENKDEETEADNDIIKGSMDFLLDYEFIRFQLDEESDELRFVPTRLGLACLSSSMPPHDGFLLFSELQRSRQNFVLESELHAIYLVTPFSVCYQLQQIDWLFFFDLWDKLPPPMKRVGEMVGIKDGFFVRAMKNSNKLDYKALQIHKR